MNDDYSPAWEVYFCHIEDQPAFVSVDLTLAEIAPVAAKPNLIEVAAALRTTDETGFPEAEEWEMLEKIEDAVVQLLEEKLGALFVGKTLHSGKRGLYFYSEQVLQLEGCVEAVKQKFPQYLLVSQATEDKDWEIYFELLYPDDESMQRIQNTRLMQQLEEQGDQAYVPRKITHWLYFKTATDRAAVLQALTAQNYTLELAEEEPKEEVYPQKLVISRQNKADDETINEVTMELFRLAQQHNGEYDGWESPVIAEND
ncbi:DUF695 domain-containing protein [Pontibacter sp. 172403-2]|uniref:DUF695 domain-containing protein n=1 Tax=Pontibacter rufus TaxID=2791028 RepID=UPI0018AF5B26|nr:DUF695 domain-containing protein [Pontibacter sp. 172403-2]MBF9254376.1 DUF695 domain-containing protein [Pontibacter sp. 172403-2]